MKVDEDKLKDVIGYKWLNIGCACMIFSAIVVIVMNIYIYNKQPKEIEELIIVNAQGVEHNNVNIYLY